MNSKPPICHLAVAAKNKMLRRYRIGNYSGNSQLEGVPDQEESGIESPFLLSRVFAPRRFPASQPGAWHLRRCTRGIKRVLNVLWRLVKPSISTPRFDQ